MAATVYVAGVGMVPFSKPGAGAPYPILGRDAARAALDDARVARTCSRRTSATSTATRPPGSARSTTSA